MADEATGEEEAGSDQAPLGESRAGEEDERASAVMWCDTMLDTELRSGK